MPLTGLIFDIQRTSLHDGPGIGTTVFLKGCPLHCLWCHNPESQSKKVEISFRAEACTLCGECVAVCEESAHRIIEGVHVYDRSRCKICGNCTEVCVYEALKVTGRPQTVEEVMAVVRRDLPYYATSGGGLTISGGEPMLQPEFTLELLKAAKDEGIQTCLDTSGLGSPRPFEQVLPWVDLFLFDYKATGAAAHARLTGVSNDRILANLDLLYRRGAAIRLRCPLVPGINDTPEHLSGIAALEKRYPRLEGIDLMPYHNAGVGKYDQYGLVNPLPEVEVPDESIKQGWLNTLRRLGSEKAKIG